MMSLYEERRKGWKVEDRGAFKKVKRKHRLFASASRDEAWLLDSED